MLKHVAGCSACLLVRMHCRHGSDGVVLPRRRRGLNRKVCRLLRITARRFCSPRLLPAARQLLLGPLQLGTCCCGVSLRRLQR